MRFLFRLDLIFRILIFARVGTHQVASDECDPCQVVTLSEICRRPRHDADLERSRHVVVSLAVAVID